MNHVERFRAVMNFQAVDRLPRWEWAMWWDQTIDRWHGEGLPRELRFSQVFDIARYFGLDPYQQFWFSTTDATIEATQHHVEGMVSYMKNFGEQAYFLNFPSKFISPDGQSLWLCYSANFSTGWNGVKLNFNPPGGRYGLCLHEVKLLKPAAPAPDRP